MNSPSMIVRYFSRMLRESERHLLFGRTPIRIYSDGMECGIRLSASCAGVVLRGQLVGLTRRGGRCFDLKIYRRISGMSSLTVRLAAFSECVGRCVVLRLSANLCHRRWARLL